MRYIDLKEFTEFGYLLEANRRFFHPLGLALTLERDRETGEYKLAGVQDYRDDPEGCLFGDPQELADKYWTQEDRDKAARIDVEWSKKGAVRMERYGFVIQPVGE